MSDSDRGPCQRRLGPLWPATRSALPDLRRLGRPAQGPGDAGRRSRTVRETERDVELIKVGRAHFDRRARAPGRAGTRARRGIRDPLPDDVTDAELPLLYALARVCVMPSVRRGSVSRSSRRWRVVRRSLRRMPSSLPELVADAGLLVPPRQAGVWPMGSAVSIEPTGWSRDWRAAGLGRARPVHLGVRRRVSPGDL